MNKDKVLVSLVKRQTDLFNRNAPETERIIVFGLIREYQEQHRGQS